MTRPDQIHINGTIVDVLNDRQFNGQLTIEDGHIIDISPMDEVTSQFILPGFIDAHVHIESSMLVPSEFARLAVRHGTVATVSDPHEIANVLGLPGVEFMLENAASTPFKFHFTAPSCVPATSFETSGATFDAEVTRQLLERDDIVALSEMMNIPGVLNGLEDVRAKLNIAHDLGKPVDGHAPELRGSAASSYIGSGISTDHECVSLEEALEKISQGMLVQIREGSAAQNLDDLHSLLNDHSRQCMLCSDDKHPDDLLDGHINDMVRRAIAKGVDPMRVLWSACVTPVQHYDLPVGLLQTGDPADLVVLEDLESCKVLQTWIAGKLVSENNTSRLSGSPVVTPNHFKAKVLEQEDLQVFSEEDPLPVIQVVDGQLVTERFEWSRTPNREPIEIDPAADILKIVVHNRYTPAMPAVAFIRGFRLREGALVSSVAHDSHNIVSVGSSDDFIVQAINRIIDLKGGVGAFSPDGDLFLPLPVAGIMSADDAFSVGALYADLDRLARQMGSTLRAPFMTLSFMALLVIPEIKLSDRGLFDGKEFKFLKTYQPRTEFAAKQRANHEASL